MAASNRAGYIVATVIALTYATFIGISAQNAQDKANKAQVEASAVQAASDVKFCTIAADRWDVTRNLIEVTQEPVAVPAPLVGNPEFEAQYEASNLARAVRKERLISDLGPKPIC